MTKYRFAELDKWVLKTKKRVDVVVKQSTNDVIKMASRTAPGRRRGGTVIPGFIPRDLGFLAGSLVSTLHGGVQIMGEKSYILVVASMEAGDLAEFGWTADYARLQHYKGWMWVDVAANNWPSIVKANITRAKVRVL